MTSDSTNDENDTPNTISSNNASTRDIGKDANKPAWAMTESAAKECDQTKEEKEEEDLLSFVDDLHFEKFSDDMELQMLIEQVKFRINTLEKEKNSCEAKLQATLDVSSFFLICFA